VSIIAITKRPNAELPGTTSTALASPALLGAKRLERVRISADIMTSIAEYVTIILRATVLIIIGILSATDTGIRISCKKPVNIFEDTMRAKPMKAGSLVMLATSTNSVAAIGQTISATRRFRRRITRAHVLLAGVIIRRALAAATIIAVVVPVRIPERGSVTIATTVVGRETSAMRPTAFSKNTTEDVATTAIGANVTLITITALLSFRL